MPADIPRLERMTSVWTAPGPIDNGAPGDGPGATSHGPHSLPAGPPAPVHRASTRLGTVVHRATRASTRGSSRASRHSCAGAYAVWNTGVPVRWYAASSDSGDPGGAASSRARTRAAKCGVRAWRSAYEYTGVHGRPARSTPSQFITKHANPTARTSHAPW